MPARSATATVSAREVYQLFRDVALQQSALMHRFNSWVAHMAVDKKVMQAELQWVGARMR